MISFLKRKYPQTFISNGLLSYNDLCILVELGVIDAPINHVNGSSIDVTLDKYIRVEDMSGGMDKVDLMAGETIKTKEIELGNYYAMPSATLLASTAETLNLPSWLSCNFYLKSSVARSGINHNLATWVDPYFKGKLTLELSNVTQFHKLILSEGMSIGQMVFTKHASVPYDKGYAVRGQYNGQSKVQESKGIK